jgi:UDP-N-acetylmuramyl pentapeptide phosphotransferase/UDP-N-acetylglucosamine-1-phosphate transferase
MITSIVFITLFILMIGYFELAKKFNIIDKPNERSSHKGLVIRGGGIVFVFAVLIGLFFLRTIPWWFYIGFVAISALSFVDDIANLSPKIRLTIQFLAVSCLLYQLEFVGMPLWLLPFLLILCLATINAYNFMDGINGMNGMYSMSVLLSLVWLNLNVFFFDMDLIRFLILSVLVFGFFNFRTKAKCFSGDVGSVSMAFVILFLIFVLIKKTGNWTFLLFLLLYGLDTFWTIVERFLNGEKLTQAHRKHFYQLLCNERKNPHLNVSFLYFSLQSIISFWVIENYLEGFANPWVFSVAVLVFGSAFYLGLKYLTKQRIKIENYV